MLCGCGYATFRDIHVKLSPPAETQIGNLLGPSERREIDEVLQITDAVFRRHRLDWLSRPVKPNTLKLEPSFVVRDCAPSVSPWRDFHCQVFLDCPQQRIEIYMREQRSPGGGPGEFEALYSELLTNLEERFDNARITVRKHVIF